MFIHLYNDRSGSPKVLLQAIKALHAAGLEVETLTSRHSGGFLDDVPGRRRGLFYRRSENKLLTLFWYLVSQVLLFFQCLAYIRKDVVFHVNTMMPFGAALAGWVMRKRVVYHVHETSIKPPLLKKILRAFIRLTARHVIFVSQYLARVEAVAGKPSCVIYNALDTLPAARVPRPADQFDILMVCSLKKYKGVDEYLHLAHRFHDRSDAGKKAVRFVLVLNADEAEVEHYFAGRALPDNLSVHARQSELSSFYDQASVLLNLSRSDEWIESFGLTIVEAMSHGLPVIVPPVGGPVELITQGEEGYRLSCYDLDTIERHLVELAEDRAFYQQMSDRAYRRAHDFLPSRFNEAITSFYRNEVFV
ncbi:glycosyltransferase family 4 protein [Marinobacterium marinum]|uniref:Glycosyltransferase family 4 protein n=1 Tax=Marinobacterium marinum TaxID=2756129 RepID=A0A7W2ABJ5_9GAMM|nr:glycosyltransferase family 4 protein [Marinobacterium marinum]MBA4501537.1 glycosyltransferase family 4 protein [Marinobacterium marinum]